MIDKLLDNLYEGLMRQKTQYRKYKRYYEGDHDILQQTVWERQKKSDRREVHNFCKLFIDNNTGFLLGIKPVMQYTLDKDQPTLVDYHNEYLGHKIQQLDQKLLRDTQIYGFAYEINYVNKDGDFDVVVKTPLEVFTIRQGNKVKYALVDQGDDIFDFFNVTKNIIIRYDRSKGYFEEVKKLNNIINNPIIVVYNDWEQISEMKPIMGLNDSYNQVSSDITSEINAFRNAYLHISGAKITKEILERMNESGIITTPNAQGNVEFITKSIDTNLLKEKLTELKKSMYDLAGQVDFNDVSIGSNTSSLALRNKLTTLINKLKLKEGFLTEGVIIRLKNLSDYLKIVDTRIDPELIDASNVSIKYTMNIPTSDKEITEMIIDLRKENLISKETAIGQITFVDEVEAEIERIQNEEEEEINQRIEGLYGSIGE